MKIIFFGTPPFVDSVIETIDKDFDLIKIIRKPIEFNHEVLNEIKELNPDLFVVASYGKILPGELLEIPKLGAINIHPSLLPKYRGPSPIQNAILEGDKKTGVTIIKMDEKMDHGPILEQVEEPVLSNDTFESLSIRLFQKSADMLIHVITRYNAGLKEEIQDEKKATYTKFITKQDGLIDIESLPEKEKLENMIRAYYPWPGVWTRYKLSEKEIIIKLLPENRIQVEGKKPMSFKDFKNGYENGKNLLQKLSLI